MGVDERSSNKQLAEEVPGTVRMSLSLLEQMRRKMNAAEHGRSLEPAPFPNRLLERLLQDGFISFFERLTDSWADAIRGSFQEWSGRSLGRIAQFSETDHKRA